MPEPRFTCTNSTCLSVFSKSILCPTCQSPVKVVFPHACPETTPEAAVVLVLDGGGMKGLSSLFILRVLMDEIKAERKRLNLITDDEPLPGNYFTFVMGTSTGGVIATMLGLFGLSVSDCLNEYQKIGDHIFGRPRHFHTRTPLFFPRSKYDTDDYADCISTFVDNKNNNTNNPPQRHNGLHYSNKFTRIRMKRVLPFLFSDKDRDEAEIDPKSRFNRPGALCKTAVFASKGNGASSEESFLFRSYDHEKCERHEKYRVLNAGKACKASIVDVVRATSVAPSYFREVKIDKEELCLIPERDDVSNEDSTPHQNPAVFIDGGTVANNPSSRAWDEACAWQMCYSGMQYSSVADAIGCIVSIGCGRTHWQLISDSTTAPLRKYARMVFSLSKMVTDTGEAHRTTRAVALANNVPYYRFNVHDGLTRTKMDEWSNKKRKVGGESFANGQRTSTYDHIKEMTRRYVEGVTQATGDPGDYPDDYPNEDKPRFVREQLRALAKVLVEYNLARDRTKSTQRSSATHGDSCNDDSVNE